MTEKGTPLLRELFVEELAQVQGGNPLDAVTPSDPELGICHFLLTTQACGEEGPPCPSSC